MMSGAQSTVLAGPPAKTPSGVYDDFLELTGCCESRRIAGESAFECLRRIPVETVLAAQSSLGPLYGLR
jgi:hypothetical protein